MSAELIILVLLIATALAFDFTNGFHDTGNAMATSIATGALKPKTAVLLAGVLNLVGAFLSVEVAVTVTTSVLKVQDSKSGELLPGIDASMGLTIIFAGLDRRHSLESADMAVRNSVELVTRVVRRADRRRTGGARQRRGQLVRCDPESADPGRRRARDRLSGRRVRHVVGLPPHPQGDGEPAARGVPLGSDRDRLSRGVVARHQRRAEDDGRHRARAHHHRAT